MKRKIILVVTLTLMVLLIAGCREADKVSYNLSKEADSFNNVRQITVMNCIKGDILFQMTGKMSIVADTEDNQDNNRKHQIDYLAAASNYRLFPFNSLLMTILCHFLLITLHSAKINIAKNHEKHEGNS